MAFTMDEEKINHILEQTEWDRFECKRALIKPEKLLETACSFSNTQGGTIAIGIEDPNKNEGPNRLYGISESPDNISEFLKLIDQNIKPNILWESLDIEIKNKDGKEDTITLVKIKKSDDIHSLTKGDTWVRKGNQNTKIGAAEIMHLKYEKGAEKYESEKTKVNTLDLVDLNLLAELKKSTKSKEDNHWQFLMDNGLAVKNNGKYYLNYAGGLLFLKNPAVNLGIKCSIKISEYFGTSQDFSEKPNLKKKPISIEGTLIDQIKVTIDYFREFITNAPPELKSGAFGSSFLIPEFAFHEAITNAVIHRNYALQDDIQVRFFSDRVEIESPGSYPGYITHNNLLYERFARNPIIERVLNKFQIAPNLDIGEGVNRIFQVMKERNLYAPMYIPEIYRPHSVLLILWNIQKTEDWDIVNDYLEKNKRITNKEARQITQIKDTIQMTRQLKNWVKQGLLENINSGKKNSFYIKPGTELI